MRVIIFSNPGVQGEVMRRDAQRKLNYLGLNADVRVETDEFSFARAGVMFTPAVAVNGKLISNGWVPEDCELERALLADKR
jgi:hypothetical protein